MKLHFTFIQTALLLLYAFTSMAQGSLQEVYQAGVKAYEEGDYASFLDNMKQAHEYRPNHPTILYNLSVAYALNNDKENAVEKLEKVLWMNAELPYQSDKDLASLRGYAPYELLNKEIEELRNPLSGGTKAFQLDGKTLHPEGIAYSSITKKFYVGSIHERKILAIDEQGNTEEFASGDELMAIMGMKVDDRRGQLWVCSTPAPEMLDYKKGSTAEILRFDLSSSSMERYAAPHSEAWLGDLTIASDGAVYTTSSSAERPAIYTIDEKSNTLKVLLEPENLVSIQGIALNEDESALFIADYRYGIFKYNLKDKILNSVSSRVKTSMKGIDGLYFKDGGLIAIHNGVKPFRIVQYELNDGEDEIVGYSFVEKGLPEMNEPTLGVIVKNELFYIVNSPWGAYNDEKEFMIEKADNPIIRRLKLQ